MNAATESTGTEGWTASTMEPVASLMTGTKLVWDVLEQAAVGDEGLGDHQQGLAVGRRAGRHLGADIAAGARLVVDDDRLAPVPGELGPERAGQDIDAGARAVRHDDGDRAACDLGGGGKEGNCYQKKRANGCAQHLVGSDDTFHCFLMLGGPISEPHPSRRIAADRAGGMRRDAPQHEAGRVSSRE
jgi:hypothetical protein